MAIRQETEKGKSLLAFKIGGSADLLMHIASEEELVEAIQWCKNQKIPFQREPILCLRKWGNPKNL